MSDEIRSYRDLIAWQKAMNFVVLVYELTENFPVREHFCLAREMRRSGLEPLLGEVGRLTQGLLNSQLAKGPETDS